MSGLDSEVSIKPEITSSSGSCRTPRNDSTLRVRVYPDRHETVILNPAEPDEESQPEGNILLSILLVHNNRQVFARDWLRLSSALRCPPDFSLAGRRFCPDEEDGVVEVGDADLRPLRIAWQAGYVIVRLRSFWREHQNHTLSR